VQPIVNSTTLSTSANIGSANSNSPSSPLTPRKRLKPLPPPVYSPGELGKLATRFSRRLARLGWARFYKSFRTPPFHSLATTLHSISHPAARLLHRLATHGVPAPSSDPPWLIARQDAAFQRGAHPSGARVHTHFLCQDMYDMVHMGYWIVLPYSTVRGLPHLKLAPVGVIPQRERRPRPIIDYSQCNLDTAFSASSSD
jgi:hypothetical protein